MITQYVERLFIDIKERQNIVKTTICSGAIKDIEQYRLLVGKLQGLEEGKILVEELYKKMVKTRMIEGNVIDSEE